MDWMNGWVWIGVGLVVALIELMLPGYLFLGTAIALVVMGVLLLAGLWHWSLPTALIAVAVLSFVAWAVLRRLLGVRQGQVRIWDRDINDP